ncbi:MAG TPA: pyridoxamine 5'-phosphate oxidase family protein [Acidimicrobiales bacterium]|nr:pyridoxamine 5'-phosphate oxidase family protein [Acidimicrobiales bacterium]
MTLRESDTSDDRAEASIEHAACLALLGDGGIGRVAVSIGAVPAVFPVNFAMLDGHVVFRTAEATGLPSAVRDAVVAFEADDFDPLSQRGWSVLVVGAADEIADGARRARAEELLLRPPVPRSEEHMMAIFPELVSGQRVPGTPPGLDRTG